MDFNEAERRFRAIDGQYRAGQIGHEQYQAYLQQLQVVDGAGRLWMMQESTGQWYVLEGDEWRAGTPPRPAGSPARPAAPPARPPGRAPARSSRGGGSRWLVLAGVTLALLACVGVIGGGILLAPRLGLGELGDLAGLIPAVGELGGSRGGAQEGAEAGEEDLGPAIEMPVKEKLLAEDGASVSDDSGASLKVPQGGVPESGKAELVIHEPPAELLDVLSESYVVETPFYAAAAEGADDGVGRATLTLPAASPDSRILALVDGRYFAILGVEPEGGTLTLNPRLGPGESDGRQMVGSLDPGGSLQYAVIHPREGAGVMRGAPGLSALMDQGGDPRECGPAIDDAGALKSGAVFVTGCRKNEEGSVLVSYPSSAGISRDVADQVVDAVGGMIGKYAGLGFTAAGVSPSAPMHLEIFKGSGDPRYKVRSGVIAIPLDVAQAIGGEGSHALYHEMAHWIQDEEYVMTWAFYWDDKVWWLEAAAENMVMLVDEGYLGDNLTTYGTISLDDNTLAFQASPYDWPTDSYVHAQLVKVNMCDDTGVCPLSQASFVKAVNEGTYPFDDSGARAKLTANLGDYARYLLGAAPERANQSIALSGAVASGDGYGEYVQVAKTTKGDFTLNRNGYEPQMATDTSGAMEAVVIDAVMQKDGVYPLRIESGLSGGRLTGLPAALRISPGAALWYRAGDGEVTFHDGTEELVIQPIHATMGLPLVRVVALGQNGGEHFKARVEMVDLSGVWVMGGGELVSSSVSCTGDEASDSGDRASIAPALIGLGGVTGNYMADATGNGLTWAEVPGRVPEEEQGGKALSYSGSALIGPEEVRVQARASIPQAEQSGGGAAGALAMLLPLGAAVPMAVVLGHGAVGRRKRIWRVLLAVGLVALGGLVLSGCFGFDFYGDVTGEITFDTLEYVGGEEPLVLSQAEMPDAEPLWRLGGGEGTYQVDLTFVVITEDDEGNEVEQVSHCTGTAVYAVEGVIAKDVILELDE